MLLLLSIKNYRWTEPQNIPPILDTLIYYQTEHKIKGRMSQVVLLAKSQLKKEDFCNFQHGSPVFISHLEQSALFDPVLIRGFELGDLRRFLSTSTIL